MSSKTFLYSLNVSSSLDVLSRIVSDCIGKDININQLAKQWMAARPMIPLSSFKNPRAHGRNI